MSRGRLVVAVLALAGLACSSSVRWFPPPDPPAVAEAEAFYRGVYALCYDAMTAEGLAGEGPRLMCLRAVDRARAAEWVETEPPGWEWEP